MAVTPPPGYTPPPADLPQRGDRATFSNRVDAWVTWFSTVILTQLAAMVASAYANAVDAAASALTAVGARDIATGARDAAVAARDLAQGYRDTAQGYRDQAAGSASAADTARILAQAAATAALSGVVTSTSTTSNPIGLGDTTFTTQAGKQFAVNVPVIAVDSTNPANYISGTIKSYSGTTLVITGTKIGGSGTLASWNISVSGVMGAQGIQGLPGGVTGGNLTNAINELRGADITSGPTPDIWGTGNLHRVTSTDTITGFPAAPQAGAERVLWIDSAGTPITNSANLIVEGGSTTLRPNDLVFIRALTTTTFIVTIERGDGTAVTPTPRVPAPRYQKIVQTTGLLYVPVDGWYRVTVGGSGGRGGRVFASSTGRATGAGGPGKAVKYFYLLAGVGYACNVGSGVAGVAASNAAIAGANGFATTFTGPGGVVITANGGGAGNASNTLFLTLLGGLGGTATGGDLNVTGGRGGNITITGTGGGATTLLTGAGAFPAQDVGYNGGDITINAVSTVSTVTVLTGGAGVGGNGGSVTLSYPGAAPSFRAATGSGGAGSSGANLTSVPSADNSSAGGDNAGGESSSALAAYVMALLGGTAGGMAPRFEPATTAANPDSLMGAGGAAQIITAVGIPTAIAGFMAGGGAISASPANAGTTAEGSRFGGSSGAFTGAVSGQPLSGATKPGFVLIEAC